MSSRFLPVTVRGQALQGAMAIDESDESEVAFSNFIEAFSCSFVSKFSFSKLNYLQLVNQSVSQKERVLSIKRKVGKFF
jgi:hypothetical protein